jgi:hypothetical protein
MSPEYQTILTIVCMLGAWFWGKSEGRIEGISMTVDLFVDNDMLKPGVKIDGVSIEDIKKEEDDE